MKRIYSYAMGKKKTFPWNFPIHICCISLVWQDCNISAWCPGFAPLSFTSWKEEILFHFFFFFFTTHFSGVLVMNLKLTAVSRGQAVTGQLWKKKKTPASRCKTNKAGWKNETRRLPFISVTSFVSVQTSGDISVNYKKASQNKKNWHKLFEEEY